ncbi:MAG TPA: hypothetical protein VMY42_25445 [Thermoguttaceae bacterium]|nr:hypothetical protein [Thermoguttaceae bacterium]
MKRLSIAVCLVLGFMVSGVAAQDADPAELGLRMSISPGEVIPTPEMWFYEQYQRDYLDPQMQVRKNAEYRAAQRQSRLAALRWFGLSNSRPRASSDPWHSDYSPSWTSNNSWFPSQWSGVGRPSIFVGPAGTSWWSY